MCQLPRAPRWDETPWGSPGRSVAEISARMVPRWAGAAAVPRPGLVQEPCEVGPKALSCATRMAPSGGAPTMPWEGSGCLDISIRKWLGSCCCSGKSIWGRFGGCYGAERVEFWWLLGGGGTLAVARWRGWRCFFFSESIPRWLSWPWCGPGSLLGGCAGQGGSVTASPGSRGSSGCLAAPRTFPRAAGESRAPLTQPAVPNPMAMRQSLWCGPRDGLALSSSWGQPRGFAPPEEPLRGAAGPPGSPCCWFRVPPSRRVASGGALQCRPQPPALLGATFAFRVIPSVLNPAGSPPSLFAPAWGRKRWGEAGKHPPRGVPYRWHPACPPACVLGREPGGSETLPAASRSLPTPASHITFSV